MQIRSTIPALLLGAMALFAACSDSEEPGEFDNWQQRNVQYLLQVADSAQKNVGGKWKIFQNYKLQPQLTLPTITVDNVKDFIFVKELVAGESTSTSPKYTDSVAVDYRGRLIPSSSYKTGYVFDQSYTEDFDLSTSTPSKFTVNGVVTGWITALQQMKLGDRWIVYIPQEQAYGTETKSGIPAYSTLIFDMYLRGKKGISKHDKWEYVDDKN